MDSVELNNTVKGAATAASSKARQAVAVDFLKGSRPQEPHFEMSENQSHLNGLIKKLAADGKMVDNENEIMYIEEFKEIYDVTEFRHSYSELTRILLACYDNPDQQHTLILNFDRIHTIVESPKYTDEESNKQFIKGFRKLYDHFRLEIARLKYIDQLKGSLKEELNAANSKIEEYTKQIKSLQENLDKSTRDYTQNINDKFNDASSQSMTILGIFSAIAFAFTGGFSIIGGVFGESINTSFRMRFIFTVFLVCFILFNILSILISSLFKLSADKSFAIPCKNAVPNKETAEAECPCNNKKCWLILRLSRRYPLVVWVNVVLVLGLVTTFLFWSFS